MNRKPSREKTYRLTFVPNELKSASVSAQSDQSRRCPHEEILNHWLSKMRPITKIYLYYSDSLESHLFIVKLGFTGVYIIFLISTEKYRLWVLVRTASARRF